MNVPRGRTGVPGHAGKERHCHCEDCKAHRRYYDNVRELDVAANGPRVLDVRPTRRIIRAHDKVGWTPKHLGAIYGVSDVTVKNIRSGKQKQVRRTLAEKVATTTPTFTNAPTGVLVPSFGVVRRVHALRALGYDKATLQPRLPIGVGDVTAFAHVQLTTHQIVAALYDELSNTWGGNEITIARARKAGYAPPAAWDDIDDPKAKPQGVIGIEEAA